MPRGDKVRAKSVVMLNALKRFQNVILTPSAFRLYMGNFRITYLLYTLVPNDLLGFSNLTLEYDHKDGDDSPHKNQSPYRETRPPV